MIRKLDTKQASIMLIIASSNSICIDPRDWIFYAISRYNGNLAIVLVEELHRLIFVLDASHDREKKKTKEREEKMYIYIPISTVKNVSRRRSSLVGCLTWLPHYI